VAGGRSEPGKVAANQSSSALRAGGAAGLQPIERQRAGAAVRAELDGGA
jgi:hypothetical protein